MGRAAEEADEAEEAAKGDDEDEDDESLCARQPLIIPAIRTASSSSSSGTRTDSSRAVMTRR